MIEQKKVLTASRLLGRSAWLALPALLGAISSLGISAGCASAPEDSAEEPESLGAATAHLDGLITSLNASPGGHFVVGLQHAAYTSFFNIKFGIPGQPPTTMTNYNGTFTLDGATAGASYAFSARECNGAAYYGWNATCSDWTTSHMSYMPAGGSSWTYAPDAGANGIGTFYGAGSYDASGTTVPLGICSALDGGQQYVGAWNNGQCTYGAGGVAYSTANANVLVNIPANAAWSKYGYGLMVPYNAMRAGWKNGSALYACQTQYQGATIPGYTTGDGCTVSWNNTAYVAPRGASSVLTYN